MSVTHWGGLFPEFFQIIHFEPFFGYLESKFSTSHINYVGNLPTYTNISYAAYELPQIYELFSFWIFHVVNSSLTVGDQNDIPNPWCILLKRSDRIFQLIHVFESWSACFWSFRWFIFFQLFQELWVCSIHPSENNIDWFVIFSAISFDSIWRLHFIWNIWHSTDVDFDVDFVFDSLFDASLLISWNLNCQRNSSIIPSSTTKNFAALKLLRLKTWISDLSVAVQLES